MENIKSSVFLELTPRQKSALCSYLRSFVKKHQNLSIDDVSDEFLNDEDYYDKLGQTHFHFVIENFHNDDFLRDLKSFIKFVFWELKYKESQKPLIEKQKLLLKQQRKKAQDYKLSKLKPTKKQLWYYEKLTKAHNIEKKQLDGATRLDLKNYIVEILDGQSNADDIKV